MTREEWARLRCPARDLRHNQAIPRTALTIPARISHNPRSSMSTTTTHSNSTHTIAWGPVIWIGVLHGLALLAFVPAYFSWSALAVCVFLHWLTGGIGICMTYHRLLTHRSFVP